MHRGYALSPTTPSHTHTCTHVPPQLLLVWCYLGGSSLVAYGGPSGGTVNLISTKENDFTKVQGMCLDYYNGFFGYTQKPASMSSVDKGWGFCGPNWLGVVMVASYTQMFAFFVMIFQTVMAHFVPGPAPLEWPCCSKDGKADPREIALTDQEAKATTILSMDDHAPPLGPEL